MGAAAEGAAAANVTDCSDAIGAGAGVVAPIAVTAACVVLDKVGAAAAVLAAERSNEESHCKKINE